MLESWAKTADSSGRCRFMWNTSVELLLLLISRSTACVCCYCARGLLHRGDPCLQLLHTCPQLLDLLVEPG